MRDDPTRFAGSIPHFYDRGMGPVIFAGPADAAARRIASLNPSRVLETAAGSGIVTRRMRDLLDPAVEIVATDLNPDMLEVARGKFQPDEKVTLQAADATSLPFADGAFDVVMCQFGVMFFPDKDRGYREAHRVLKSGGHYVFSVWDAFEHVPYARIVSDALRQAFETDPPPFLSVPFGYSAIDPIKASLLASGFEGLSVEVVRMRGPIADFDAFAAGVVRGSPLADQIRSRGADPQPFEERVGRTLREAFGAGDMPLQFLLFDAWRA